MKQPSWREIAALPFYLVGAMLWAAGSCVLIVADKVANKRHGQRMIG